MCKPVGLSSAAVSPCPIIGPIMIQLAMDCPQVAPDVYRRCLSAAEAILAAAGFTAQDVFEAKQLMDGWDSEHAGRQPEMSSHEALAAFNLAELAAQAESGQAADCHLTLVERLH